MSGEPYKITPEFDQDSLPAGLRRVHSTKEDCWGLIRMIEGRLRLSFPETGRQELLDAHNPGLVEPGEPHLVEPLGPIRMRVEFYRKPPASRAGRAAPAEASG